MLRRLQPQLKWITVTDGRKTAKNSTVSLNVTRYQEFFARNARVRAFGRADVILDLSRKGSSRPLLFPILRDRGRKRFSSSINHVNIRNAERFVPTPVWFRPHMVLAILKGFFTEKL